MQKYFVAALMVVAFASLAALVIRVWFMRRNTQEQSIAAPAAPFENAEFIATGFYVATTFAGRPLDRVIAHGLAHRGRASFGISSEGLSITRDGETAFGIPKQAIVSVLLEQGTIDRVVEKQGLISVCWTSGASTLETSIRIVDRENRIEFFNQLESFLGKELIND